MRTPPPPCPAPAVHRPVPGAPRPVPNAPGLYQLADGRILLNLRLLPVADLAAGAWIAVGGRPFRIADMRLRHGGGRILILAGTRLVLRVGRIDEVLVFTVLAPAGRRGRA
ncbi:hypothetical protein [Kitasatospora sp. NPDC059571]|uniref:hypothetical protein n=1 Tax=Kitasatospora sp. NPDC059571 TaxID=3346871 RepID=UPI00369EF4B3